MFLAISDILFFALVFVLEVGLLWYFLGLAQQFYIRYIARVLIHGLDFPLYVPFNMS